MIGLLGVLVGCSGSQPAAVAGATNPGVGSNAGSPGGAAGSSPAQPPAPDPTPIPTVAAATDLAQQTADEKTLTPNGWGVKSIVVSFSAPAGVGQSLIPQVEVEKTGEPFQGNPTVQGAPVAATGASVSATITLKDLSPGQYKWQARFADASTKQNGPWSIFDNGDAGFGIVDAPPTVQNLAVTGASQQVAGVPAAAAKDHPELNWTIAGVPSAAVDHLAFLADQQKQAPDTPPDKAKSLAATAQSVSLDDLKDGDWYLHLWALDKAGETSAPATVAVTVLRTPPQISNVLFRSWATNPDYQTVPINFQLSQPSTVSVVIMPADSDTVIRSYDLGQQKAGQKITVSWDGKDAKGKIVAPGSYRFMVNAVDAVGNKTQALYKGVTITNKVIKVSLATESMTAYEGSQEFLHTLVTTGGQELPTRPGTFEILSKQSPFIFHAQYPKGSPFWFPDIKSNMAMLYDQPDADFIHDAPWRSEYGPGTNGPGIPGSARTGSHGCVETPHDAMAKLYQWTPLGTPVIVSPP